MKDFQSVKLIKPEVEVNTCQSEARSEFIYVWRLRELWAIVWPLSQTSCVCRWRVASGVLEICFFSSIMPRSFLVKRRKSEDVKSELDSGKLMVNLIIPFISARVLDRTIDRCILFAVPQCVDGRVPFSSNVNTPKQNLHSELTTGETLPARGTIFAFLL